MARARRNKPVYEDCVFDDSEGAIMNDGLQTGLAQREKMNITGCVTKVPVGGEIYEESTNQKQGGAF